MIGNNEIDAQAARRVRRGKGPNAGVYADDEPNAGCCRALDYIVFHTVAFANAVRHVELGSAAAQFNRGLQNNDGGGPVDVIVTVDENSFLPLDSSIQTVDSGFHAAHQVRGVQMTK